MSTANTMLNLVFPQYTQRYKSWHLPTIDVEKKIFTIIDAYIQPSSEGSVTTAAREIVKLFPQNAASPPVTLKGDSEEVIFLMILWELFVVVVEQIPWQHPSQGKVVELIKAIRDLPNPITITLEETMSDGVKLWPADLPVLDGVLVDNVETHGIIINDDSDEEKQSRLRDINFQGFAARLTTEGVFDISRLGVYRLRDLLEEDLDYYLPGFDNQGVHLDACILPAAVWISLTAKIILGFCRVNGDGANRNDMHGGKHWKGSKGFSVGQWDFWKQRLEEVAVNDEASEETRSIAKKMKESMIAAEVRLQG